MPQVLVFANGVQSHGDGFIKTASSGMWQCTLGTDAPPLESGRGVDVAAGVGSDGLELHTKLTSPLHPVNTPTIRAKTEGEATTTTVSTRRVQQQLRPLPFSQKFQLISFSSRYLCCVLVAFHQHLLSEVQIISLQKLPQRVKLPDNVSIAFASANEATWADVISFLQQQSFLAFSVDISHTAVWRLDWAAPMEDNMDVGAAFLWCVTGSLPLCGRVQDAFVESGDTLFVAVNSVKSAPHTPPNCVLPELMEPPPLRPKSPRRHEPAEELPQRDLSVEFQEGQKRRGDAPVEAVGEGTTEENDKTKEGIQESAVAKPENAVRQPTYAEILKMGGQRGSRPRTIYTEYIRDWRRRIIALKLQLRCGSTSADAMLHTAREQLLQQQRDTNSCGQMSALLSVSLKELICGLQFDAAARRVVYRRKSRTVALLMRECVDVARVVGDEVDKWTGDAAVLPFSQHVMQLRLIRHRCCATVLLGHPVGLNLLHEMLRVGKRLMAFLQSFPQEGCGGEYYNSDTAVGQLVSGVLTAAISLLEVSVFAWNGKNIAMWDEMTCAASMLLLWLRDASGGIVEIPISLVAQMKDEAAGRSRKMGELLQRCTQDYPAVPRQGNGRELCCGLVRTVPCGVVFDQRFASSLALFKRIEAVVGCAALT